MALAILTQDVIASDEDGESKVFPSGLEIDVEDWDESWFNFYDSNDNYFESEEKPSLVLAFQDSEFNDQGQEDKLSSNAQYPVTEEEAYKPVPNMTPLKRKFLLL